MSSRLTLGDIDVEVVFKEIKNVHLSIHPPTGRVRISAPSRTSIDTIRAFAISKLSWIRQQQDRLQRQERETPREYLERESHFVWGKRYLLEVVEENAAPRVELKHGKILLRVRPETDREGREALLSLWYREQIRATIPTLIAKWEPIIGARVEQFFVQRMKTRWGSCNQEQQTIRLNTALAKKPKECLEYVLVHEMAHILEPGHGKRFVALIDRCIPNWPSYRALLNQLPVSHEDWAY